VESPAEDPVGGGVEGGWEEEEPVEEPRPTGQRAVQQGSAGLPLCYRRRKAGAG